MMEGYLIMASASGRVRKYLKERTTLRIWLTSLIVAIFGCGLLIVAELNRIWIGYESIQSVVRDMGSLLIASVAIALLWELIGKRAFQDELLEKIRLSEDIRICGIIGFTPNFRRNIDWEALFHNAKSIDLFFIYGRTWRHTHGDQLLEAAKRHVRFRVVLPDPDDDIIMSIFARRFIGMSKEQIRDSIKEAAEDFKRLQAIGARVNVWYLNDIPMYSFYRFDSTTVWAVYSHQRNFNQKPMPVFILNEDGELYKFVRSDFEAVVNENNGLAKLI